MNGSEFDECLSLDKAMQKVDHTAVSKVVRTPLVVVKSQVVLLRVVVQGIDPQVE